MQEVEVIFDPETGEREYAIQGVQGGACTDITDAIVQANEHVDTKHTEEFVEQQELPDYIANM